MKTNQILWIGIAILTILIMTGKIALPTFALLTTPEKGYTHAFTITMKNTDNKPITFGTESTFSTTGLNYDCTVLETKKYQHDNGFTILRQKLQEVIEQMVNFKVHYASDDKCWTTTYSFRNGDSTSEKINPPKQIQFSPSVKLNYDASGLMRVSTDRVLIDGVAYVGDPEFSDFEEDQAKWAQSFNFNINVHDYLSATNNDQAQTLKLNTPHQIPLTINQNIFAGVTCGFLVTIDEKIFFEKTKQFFAEQTCTLGTNNIAITYTPEALGETTLTLTPYISFTDDRIGGKVIMQDNEKVTINYNVKETLTQEQTTEQVSYQHPLTLQTSTTPTKTYNPLMIIAFLLITGTILITILSRKKR